MRSTRGTVLVVTLLIALIAHTAVAQDKPRVIHFYNLAWSPDGKKIVFSSARSGHLDLYLMNTDGSSQTRITNTPSGGFYQSSFSPDGKRIAFQGRSDSGRVDDHLYVVSVDGSGWRQLTDSTTTSMSPRWAADGQWIVFDQHPVTKWFWKDLQRGDLKPMQEP